MSKEMPNGLDKKTVKGMDDSQKIDVLVDYVASLGTGIDDVKQQLASKEEERQTCDEEQREECRRRWADHCNPRFNKLENFKWQALGIVGGLAFLGTTVGPIVAAWIGSVSG